MNDRNQNRLLTILGIITAVVTILVQVVSIGELKGKIETVVSVHERRLDNSGTVYDGGGNVSNNKTGAGTISIPTL